MQNTLREGAVGWVLLASLGVSYVIAGDYSAWNFGMQHGGWGGLVLAVAFGAAMYSALLASLAELATIIPEAGAGSAFAERAFGPVAACLTGGCILIEYCAAAAVVAVFVGAYTRPLLGIGGPAVILGVFLLFIAIHAAGVGEALRVLLGMTIVALLGLVVFVAATMPLIRIEHYTDVAAGGAWGASRWLPGGWIGVWAALPFGTAFFLAVEGVAMAAEETRDPHRNLPRGMFAALLLLAAFAVLIVVAGPGAAGVRGLRLVDDPIVAGLQAAGAAPWVVRVVNVCGLAGLLACLFSAIFGYSRLAFALARAGYLPRALGRTNSRMVPLTAIVVPGILACILALTGAADEIFVLMVSAGTLSYLLMLPAHWIMRRRAADLPRPYRTPGGVWTAGFAWCASLLSFAACFIANPLWSSVTIGLLALFLVGYLVRRRRRR